MEDNNLQISVAEYRKAKKIIELYKKQKKHKKFLEFLPKLEPGMVLEYRDLAGYWYEYTPLMQNNMFFHPKEMRVRMK